MKAAIMVGGNGTRMGNKIKPLLKKNGKTVLSYVLDNLKKYSINDIYLIINDKEQFKKLGYKTITSLKELKNNFNEDFLLLVGDSIINLDFNKLIHYHNINKNFTTVVTSDYEIPYGAIRNNVWVEKPKQEVAIGIFVMKPKNLKDSDYLPDLIGKFKTFKFEGSFIHLTYLEDYEKWKKSKF